MSEDIRVGDVGTLVRVIMLEEGEPVDLRTATLAQIKFQSKTKEVLIVNAEFDNTSGSNGVMQYILREGDIDTAGEWKIQGYVELPDGKWHSDIQTFEAGTNIPSSGSI